MAKLFELIDVQEIEGQTCINRYYYDSVSNDVKAEQVADTWALFVLPNVLAIQSNELTHKSIVVKELLEGKDQHLLNLSGAVGGKGGHFVSAFYAFGFTLFAGSGNFRAGGKRYSGVSEDVIADGGVSASHKLLLAALSADLDNELIVNTSLNTVTPVLARLINNGTQYLVTPIVQASFTRLTSQNSRKTYKGGGTFVVAAPNKDITWDGVSAYTDLSAQTGTGKQANGVTWDELIRSKGAQ